MKTHELEYKLFTMHYSSKTSSMHSHNKIISIHFYHKNIYNSYKKEKGIIPNVFLK